MTHLNPYLNFNGQCRDALTFYQECFDGQLELQKVAESPMAAKMPSEKGPLILHGALTKDGHTLLMGSDMIGNALHTGNSIMLCLNCSRYQSGPVPFWFRDSIVLLPRDWCGCTLVAATSVSRN